MFVTALRISVATLATLLLSLAPRAALAQSESGAQSTLIPASIEAAGMGQSGTALFWLDDATDWANPALLSERRGIRYSYGKTRLVPDLASGVYFDTRRVVVGGWGVGVDLAGKPASGIGRDRLDYGRSVATDVDGNPIGEFSSWEVIRSFGVGVAVVRTLESLGSLVGLRGDPLSRYGDISLGHTRKHVEVNLAPAFVALDGRAADGRVVEKDRGLFVRVTPYDAIGHPGLLPGLERTIRIRVDGAYGASERNYSSATITYIDESQADPVDEEDRKGTSMRISLTVPESVEEGWRARHRWWMADAFLPFFSFGATWESSRYRTDASAPVSSKVTRSGWEATIANFFSLRRGHIDDPVGTVVGDTWGWGIGLDVAHVAGVRYDRASVPQSKYLEERVIRNGVVVFFDPVEAWKRLR